MDFLETIDPELNSLMAVLLVPLLYWAALARLKHRWVTLKRTRIIFLSLLSLAFILLCVKLQLTPSAFQWQEFRWYLAHLLAIMVAGIVCFREAPWKIYAALQQASQKTSEPSYQPAPKNPEVEKVGWEGLIIDNTLRQEIVSVVQLLRDPATAARYGIEVPKGMLLDGPPGNGKTTLAKVIATTAGMAFFVLRMDEVVSKWVGESEKNLTALFNAAQKAAPAVIFIDEIDSIGRERSGGGVNHWAENLLNHLLQLVDGVLKSEGLYIIGATNRADLVDPALKRAGRLSRVIKVPLPDAQARLQLFKLYLSKLHLSEHIDLSALVTVTEGRSCADIKGICNQAGLNAFKRESVTAQKQSDRKYTVTNEDLERALNELA